MKKLKVKWSDWRLCGIGENLHDLQPEDLITFKALCREYYQTEFK
jgi:hypothetical protein